VGVGVGVAGVVVAGVVVAGVIVRGRSALGHGIMIVAAVVVVAGFVVDVLRMIVRRVVRCFCFGTVMVVGHGCFVMIVAVRRMRFSEDGDSREC